MEVSGSASRLSYQLTTSVDRGEFLRSAAEAIAELLPADSLGWISAKPGAAAEIYGTEDSDRPEISQAVARVLPIHPMWTSYSEKPDDLAPRRMSDLVSPRMWLSHPVYSELFIPLGAVHQLTIILAPVGRHGWTGWCFHRRTRDFSDNELELALRLRPMLIALDRASRVAFGRMAEPDQLASREHLGLTSRENEVLGLLAGGLTATAIAHVCRLSPRTVRKHLEHIYAKLGCHDRLQAVQKVAMLGRAT